MTDVLKIAIDRRAELHEEIAKLDEFIRMAEQLIRTSQQRAMHVGDEEAMPRRPARVASSQPSEAEYQPRRPDVGEKPAQSGQISRPQVIRRAPMAQQPGQAAG